MRNAKSVLTLTVLAAGTIAASRFVDTALAQVSSAGANTYGVSTNSAVAGDLLAVDVLGTAIVETGAAIAAGAKLQADASGRAITYATGAITGRLAPGESASAAGQFVEVILIPN